jgi:hypothetical protein
MRKMVSETAKEMKRSRPSRIPSGRRGPDSFLSERSDSPVLFSDLIHRLFFLMNLFWMGVC